MRHERPVEQPEPRRDGLGSASCLQPLSVEIVGLVICREGRPPGWPRPEPLEVRVPLRRLRCRLLAVRRTRPRSHRGRRRRRRARSHAGAGGRPELRPASRTFDRALPSVAGSGPAHLRCWLPGWDGPGGGPPVTDASGHRRAGGSSTAAGSTRTGRDRAPAPQANYPSRPAVPTRLVPARCSSVGWQPSPANRWLR